MKKYYNWEIDVYWNNKPKAIYQGFHPYNVLIQSTDDAKNRWHWFDIILDIFRDIIKEPDILNYLPR